MLFAYMGDLRILFIENKHKRQLLDSFSKYDTRTKSLLLTEGEGLSSDQRIQRLSRMIFLLNLLISSALTIFPLLQDYGLPVVQSLVSRHSYSDSSQELYGDDARRAAKEKTESGMKLSSSHCPVGVNSTVKKLPSVSLLASLY
ncbi:hypothetical protein RND81_13G168700 [Saponaria officinalis]|uniref:Uncharacterized protein n=1 Tax=Saponaria officinalis TaxID=3572 RepID=A0AAW1GYP4_SAPOF